MLNEEGRLVVHSPSGQGWDDWSTPKPVKEQPSLLEGIRSLSSLKQNHIEKEVVRDVEGREVSLFSAKKNRKKDGKKKKKESKGSFGETSLLRERFNHDKDDDGDSIPLFRPISFADAAEMYDEDDEDSDITVEISREQKKTHRKKDNEFEKRFDDELTVLYDMLEDLTKFNDKLTRKLDAMEGRKVQGTGKFTADLVNSILSAKTSKLHVVKEIAAIKKAIQDMKFKAAQREKDSGSTSRDEMAAAYLSKLVNGMGRNTFIDHATGGGITYDTHSRYEDDDAEVAAASFRGDDDDAFDHLQRRLNEENNPYRRSADSHRYLKYENRGVNICIYKCIETGEWEFIAVDRDNIRLDDGEYPLPDKEVVKPLRFSPDGSRGTDKQGMSYRVIEYSEDL